MNTAASLVERVAPLALLLGAIGALFQSLTPAYLTLGNIEGMLRAMSITGIVSIGLTFVIAVRKFDLSLAGVGSFAAMTLGFVLAKTGSLAATVAACLAAGLVCGFVNGLLIGLGGLPDVVTTIAVGSIAYGLAFMYNGGATFSDNFFSSGMVTMNFKKVLGLQLPIFLLAVTTLLAGYVLHVTRFGQLFYATGENPVAARFSGVAVWKVLAVAFGICGTLVGLAMLLQVSGIGSSRVSAGGQLLLPAYTSVYLGAALLGRPSVPATIVGSLSMTMLLNGFTLLSVPYYYSDAVVSLVLIIAIVLFNPQIMRSLRRPFRISNASR